MFRTHLSEKKRARRILEQVSRNLYTGSFVFVEFVTLLSQFLISIKFNKLMKGDVLTKCVYTSF